MQIETVLDSWRNWSAGLKNRPVIGGELSGGRSNRSFLVDSDGVKMVLRINGAGSLLPDTNRDSEIKIWRSASKKGIAPPLVHVDDKNRFLVSIYIDNSLPPQPQHDEFVTGQAFSLLKQCHRLNAEAPTIDYAAHIEQYWQIITNRDIPVSPTLSAQREPMLRTLENITTSGTPTGLCHHDPVTANFVGSSKKLYLIDWEYAARGLRVMDYAALCVEWGIDDAVVAAQTGIDMELLAMTKSFYRYQSQLWSEITEFRP